MSILVLVLSVAAALAIALTAYRARTLKRHRLTELVGADPLQATPHHEQRKLSERLLPQTIGRHLRLLGIEPRPDEFALVVGGMGVVAALVGALWGILPALALVAALLVLGAMILNILANRRIAELGAMMPGFFDRIRQLIIVGNSLPTAFARAMRGAQPRLVAFFAPTLRRIGNGASFSESIKQSAEDIDLYEMHLFATAVSANTRFGGSLTHALGNLVNYLRKRSSIERELRANTAQIRFSAWLLALLPLLVASLIIAQNPEYARWFVTDPVGRWLLTYCIVSQVVGAIIMRLIIRTEF